MNLAASISISLIVPIIFLFVLQTFDLLKTVKFRNNILTLIWGAAAYYLAAQINPLFVKLGLLEWDQVVRYVAPVVEELLKSLILIYLATRPEFNYVVDGALYGFGAGIGFAIIENVEYVRGNIAFALFVALARVFSTNLMHATSSGLIGTALAFNRGEKNKLRGGFVILGGYLLAIFFHGAFNTMVNAGVFLPFAIGYGVFGVALIWYVIRRGMAAQKDWVSETLGDQDRVTKEETRAITGIDKIVETLILPFRERFGNEKVPLVKELMYKQAEMGIKRKLLDATPSPTKQKEVENIIQTLYKEMEELRRQIGLYPMMFVREVYLGQDINAWDVLGTRIAETGTGQRGGGLWDAATARIKQSKSQEDKS
ncbi:MAG: PrsW family intramembrane metalloprotease [Anaerolineales bacterium]|nr:PrsW family intramembrane metalloprotease [Anaerolineales bacterium]